ncbi:hypothetical protein JXE04_02370 [Patescibacteria group bacterium]|nr:hypothetical protein [Patescibacteria group bacterium]
MLMPLIPKKKSKYHILWQKYRWWIILAVIILIFIILLSPYVFRPWTRYPEVLRTKIAWRNFEATFQESCREECLSKRQSYAIIWRQVYKRRPELLTEYFQSVFSGDNRELQSALIKIMAADSVNKNLPALLAQVIADKDASLENKRLIVNLFSESFADDNWLDQLRTQISDAGILLADRLYALSLLKSYPNPANALILKNIILNNSPEELLGESCQLAGEWDEKLFVWTETDMDIMAQIIAQAESGPQRWRRIWLLLLIKAHDSKLQTILRDVAENITLDNISRGLAAEALKNKFSLDINTPEPTAAEWQVFYEKI